MIKKYLPIFALLLIAFSSCSDEEVSQPETNSNFLLGKWIENSSSINNEENDGINEYVVFTSDYRTEFVYYDEFASENGYYSEFGDWKIEGSTITITWDESDPGLEIYKLTIIQLDDSALIWKHENKRDGVIIQNFKK